MVDLSGYIILLAEEQGTVKLFGMYNPPLTNPAIGPVLWKQNILSIIKACSYMYLISGASTQFASVSECYLNVTYKVWITSLKLCNAITVCNAVFCYTICLVTSK